MQPIHRLRGRSRLPGQLRRNESGNRSRGRWLRGRAQVWNGWLTAKEPKEMRRPFLLCCGCSQRLFPFARRIPHSLMAPAISSIVRPLAALFGASSMMFSLRTVSRKLILLFDQQPVCFLGSPNWPMHANQYPIAFEFFPRNSNLRSPSFQTLIRVAVRDPVTPVPHHHGPAAVLPLRNLHSKSAVFPWVVLDLNREPFVARDSSSGLSSPPSFSKPRPGPV